MAATGKGDEVDSAFSADIVTLVRRIQSGIAHGHVDPTALVALRQLQATVEAFDGQMREMAAALAKLDEQMRPLERVGVLDEGTIKRMIEAQRIKRATLERLLSHPALDGAAVAITLDITADPKKAVAELRRSGHLLGLQYGDRYLYPRFQFDISKRMLRRAVAEVNEILGAGDEPIAVGSWWVSPNALLDDRPPMEAVSDVETEPRVREAALALIEPLG